MGDQEQDQEDKRRHYRLRYPMQDRPKVRIDGREYEVADLSEGGVKILCPNACPFHPGQGIAGTLKFRDGEIVAIEGEVVRCSDEAVAVKLSKGIAQKRMLAEQLRLRGAYPWLFDRPGSEGQKVS